MKRANGLGSVYKLKGKRRNPWVVRVCTGYTDDGKSKHKYIGYAKTRKEAEELLSQYRAVPDTVTEISLADAWTRYAASFNGSPSTLASYRSAFKRLEKWHKTTLDKITLDMLQEMCDLPPATYSRAVNVKKLMAALFSWAYAHDCCPASRKELLEYIQLPKRPVTTKSSAWTADEVHHALDKHQIGPILLIFTGLRMGELLALTADQIHLKEQYIDVQKSKTKAGIRKVPIPTGLLPWLREFIIAGGVGRSRTYFNDHFWPDEIQHTHHDCRHTYITLLTRAHVDERMIKTLVGHAGGVTTDVYTHFTMQEKISVVDKAFHEWLYAPTGTYEFDHLRA